MHTYKRALVLGHGRSGRAAELLLRREGARVEVICEEKTPSYCWNALALAPEVAVLSPGFALDHPWVVDLARRGVPLISELELGWSRRRSSLIAVTGSNGKSSVVKWLSEALSAVGQPAVACGNYGLPISEAMMSSSAPRWLVAEVSSFQLESVREFQPQIGVLLNVLPNHLDRHGDLKTYQDLKLRLFSNMDDSGVAIVPVELFERLSPDLRARACEWKTFGATAAADYCFRDGWVGAVDLRGTYFDNEVLGPAAAAVAAVWDSCGLAPEDLAAAARRFEPLPHRMQPVATIAGVQYVDDSKATNLAAMCAALRMSSEPVHLIAGGRPKESDWSFAKDLLVKRVRRLYLIGEACDAMQSAWGASVDCVPCGTLNKAVVAAQQSAQSGELVLLSPACTSFDQFGSFGERGDEFVREVTRLKNGASM